MLSTYRKLNKHNYIAEKITFFRFKSCIQYLKTGILPQNTTPTFIDNADDVREYLEQHKINLSGVKS